MVCWRVVVASYRQVVRAYPSGGGAYEVASTNLGRSAGLVVAGALLVDYVMTVAVSVAAGVDNIISAVPELNPYRVLINVGFVAVLTAINLRGVRESGRAFAVPTYLFMVGVLVLVSTGLLPTAVGDPPRGRERRRGRSRPSAGHMGLTGLALVLLALRAFSSGCTALTGVEAISNGVPAFRPPKSRERRHAPWPPMGLLVDRHVRRHHRARADREGALRREHLRPGRLPGQLRDRRPAHGHRPARRRRSSAATHSVGFFYIQAATALILILAANTAFNGFPLLGSILAQDRYLPRQLHTRGDRLVFSNGIILLAGFAMLPDLARSTASVTRLIQLYILGVFTSFTLGQAGMVRHWNRTAAYGAGSGGAAADAPLPGHQRDRRLLTGLVLVIVLATKFTHGAYLVVVIAVPLLFLMMRVDPPALRPGGRGAGAGRRRRHAAEPHPRRRARSRSCTSRPLRALAYAQATRPDTLTALTVNVADDETRALQARVGPAVGIPVPLTIVDSPYREITRPVLDYVSGCAGSPRATWSSSTSRSTWSAAGGSTCCTTRARCG